MYMGCMLDQRGSTNNSLITTIIFSANFSGIQLQGRIQDFPYGGRGPLMWAFFGENVSENKRIGSHWGGGGEPCTGKFCM